MRFAIFDWRGILLAACGFAILLAPAISSAQSKWTITTSDFETRQIDLASIDDAGVKLPDQKAMKWDELLLLDRDSTARPASTGKFILYLVSGDQLRGEPDKLDNETLHWNATTLGPNDISLKQVAGISRAGRAPSFAGGEKRSEDVVTLANGDSVHGILSSLGEGSIKIQSQGNEVAIPLDSVASLVLASAGPGATSRPTHRAFRVSLGDDSIVTASSLKSDGPKLRLQLPVGERIVPLDSVDGIEQLDGPVSWLSSRQPLENVQTPLLDTTRPSQMDRTVTGKPIAFGDHVYARGIGVEPYSKITWSLENGGAYKAFRAQYAMDGKGAYADVTIRIKLDGKVAHEQKTFTAGQLSPVVLVPLGKAKTLTLEVDFGGNYNVQDHFNWIEPALTRSASLPASRPARPASAPAAIRTTAPVE